MNKEEDPGLRAQADVEAENHIQEEFKLSMNSERAQMIAEDKAEKSSRNDEDDKLKRKKKRKKKKKKNDNKSDSSDFEEEPMKKIKTSKLLIDENIPESLREFYAEVELNPLKLVIGNIPINITTEELREYFHTLLVSLSPSLRVKPPIKMVHIGETKNFAIIEFHYKEAVKVCKTLENLEYQGFKLSIQKGKGFFSRLYEKKDNQDFFGNIITNAAEVDHKVYMGGLPTYLKEEDVKKLCEAFGMMKYFNLVKDPANNTSKGYCFFEYLDPKVTDKAIKGLNNMEVGDRKLKVQRASAGANKKIAETQNKQPSNASGSFLGSYPGIKEPAVQVMLNIPQTAITPSRVIQILNMVSLEDLVEDDFYKELIEDVKEECSKYGPVERVEIPRPDKETGIAGPAVGKIFVKFQYLIPSKKAQYFLSGRTYNKRTVITSFYPEDKFELKEYLIKG